MAHVLSLSANPFPSWHTQLVSFSVYHSPVAFISFTPVFCEPPSCFFLSFFSLSLFVCQYSNIDILFFFQWSCSGSQKSSQVFFFSFSSKLRFWQWLYRRRTIFADLRIYRAAIWLLDAVVGSLSGWTWTWMRGKRKALVTAWNRLHVNIIWIN
jgi:hypothetical protein